MFVPGEVSFVERLGRMGLSTCGTNCYQINDLEHSAHGTNGLQSASLCGQGHSDWNPDVVKL